MHGCKMTSIGYPKGAAAKKKFGAKVKKVMDEAKEGELHSGSKEGPLVTKHSQKVAIALSKARKAVAPKKKKK